jgi:hypothetical protein
LTKIDVALPAAHDNNWKAARRESNESAPRYTSYQAPGGKPVTFVQKSFDFLGGQTVDTAEYPFDGKWSNERLNETPQTLTVEGYLRGVEYIAARTALIEAFRVPTDDDTPGYLDLPFWGRFPVVVIDYKVSETTDEQGQCAINLMLKRACVSATERAAVPTSAVTITEASEKLKEAAVADFKAKLKETIDPNTLASAHTKLIKKLLDIIGRVRGIKTAINTMVGKVTGITNLIAEGVRLPGELAMALFNAGAAIFAGIMEIVAAAKSYIPGEAESTAAGVYPSPPNSNIQNALLMFLSAASFELDLPAATVQEQTTKEATENLYRMVALSVASALLTEFADSGGGESEGGSSYPSYQKVTAYMKLLEKLDESINKENPAVYAALEGMRVAVSQKLIEKELNAELRRDVSIPMPLLALAHYLGCDEAKLRELNSIADSFVIQGSIIYV